MLTRVTWMKMRDREKERPPVTVEYRPGNLPGMRQAIVAAFDAQAPEVILDLDPLGSLDTDAVRGLIALLRQTRSLGELALHATKSQVLQTLCITALDRLFAIYPGSEAA